MGALAARLSTAAAIGIALIATSAAAGHVRYSVHDGDTFRIGRERIRVLGMDAPEIGSGARCAREQKAAIDARDFLRNRMDASEVRIERHGHDIYGRTLARVYVDGSDVAELMLANGLARPYTPGHHPNWCR